ncbi:hypothetical protein ABB37_00820 [Leptomonas pyrrhocoris]|uniref:Inosine/uridine-preferring nucleoside hydrolase domain-containing protein n=1 Tax=Leptomonas pyrrhocoris TaxID=157538 RepID=A0A0M9GB53_LEPPY|nr:hypothetical protein ABB37_00820 [Leptomonas pyrrhocoris]XP_015665179.1 hypothetical protein ABB37_00820 [Leptomonas pyrrhocoris]KPA86739.1 hypothetical protein ABB37_00820 [Leptomonas pyrrhocoris]KPA86740.1 hypothetical protein ABB37_00820 [Leptomonas pyrrhocoris]|eukprot:XP_015665178.1 hypothetical protein ABB37_00820 [Leptomonas pyrrhocoris]
MEQVKEYYAKWTEVPQPRKIKTAKLIAFVSYFLFLLLLVVYAFGRTGKKTVTVVPTILFTDGTPYNLEVVRYLAQRRDVVIGMIVVATNALADAQLKANATSVTTLVSALQSEGLKTRVPDVYSSYDAATDSFLGPLDAKLASTTVNFLIVGPCTDAAYFLQQYAGRRGNVNKIYVAGGAFNTAGNAKFLNTSITGAERNFYLDPAAADYVVAMKHARPVVMLPLDAALTWTSSAYSAIVSNSGTTSASATAVAEGLRWYYDAVDKTKRVTVGMAAAAYAVDTEVQTGVKVTTIPVRVYTSAADARYGQSFRPPASAEAKLVTVVLSLNEGTFFSHLTNVDTLALA